MSKWPTDRKKFKNQRIGAARRGVEFLLSFEEWREIWRQSGHWEQRGCTSGKYCMCRIGDVGPYVIGNVFIGLHAANVSFAKNPHKKLPIGVRQTKSGTFEANKAGRYIGTFSAVELARAAYQDFRL